MVRWVGLWPGIAITTALYVLAHLPKPSAGETLACMPMGVVFALVALAAGSAWPAALLHLAIALTSETLTALADPAVEVLPGRGAARRGG